MTDRTYIDLHAPTAGDPESRQQVSQSLTLAVKRRAQQRPLAFAAAETPGGRGGTRLDLYRLDDRTVRLRFASPDTPAKPPRGARHIASVDATVAPDRDAVTDAAAATGTNPQEAARYAVLSRVARQAHKYAGPLAAAVQRDLHAAPRPDAAAERTSTAQPMMMR
jgi:hypothetical protein